MHIHTLLYLTLYTAGDTGMPQEFTSNLRKDSETGHCEVHFVLRAQRDISHYRVYINGDYNILNMTNNTDKRLILGSYPTCVQLHRQ